VLAVVFGVVAVFWPQASRSSNWRTAIPVRAACTSGPRGYSATSTVSLGLVLLDEQHILRATVLLYFVAFQLCRGSRARTLADNHLFALGASIVLGPPGSPECARFGRR